MEKYSKVNWCNAGMDDLMDFQISSALFTNGKKTLPRLVIFYWSPEGKIMYVLVYIIVQP